MVVSASENAASMCKREPQVTEKSLNNFFFQNTCQMRSFTINIGIRNPQ